MLNVHAGWIQSVNLSGNLLLGGLQDEKTAGSIDCILGSGS
jgi:hypothetical protein